ncbi:MAG: FtsX-like permease family protein [Chloroflexi bacterium]|nr:FtsX-like permease family protein [Chloroflexota bacterium]
MEELFGVSMNTIATVVIAITLVIFALLAWVAFRNPVMFKTGLRNIPRRRAQTTLIIFGLMLATVIMTAAFGTGDTVSSTVTDDIYELTGETDMLIVWDEEGSPRPEDERVIPLEDIAAWEARFAGDPDIDGFLPILLETLPVVNTATQLNESSATVVAYDTAAAAPFGSLRDLDGNVVTVTGNQIVLNEDLAGEIDAEVGHTLVLLYQGYPVEVVVAAIAPNSFLSGTFNVGASEFPGGAVSFEFLAEVIGRDDIAYAVVVTNAGGVKDGLERSDVVEEKLNEVIDGTPYEVVPLKKDAIEIARLVGSVFTTVFIIFGLFSIAAGILLIFLIFIMLAAERKPEMGMARAVGAKRRHLVESFLAEGMGYDLGAAIVGLIAGVFVTFGMVGLINAFAEAGLGLELHTNLTPRSLAVAFCLGVISTFIVIFLAAVRASRLNIVSAIRDLPEPIVTNPEAATWRGYARAVLNAAVAGGAVAVSVFALYRLPDLAPLFTIALLFGLVGPFLFVLRRHNFGAPRHERLPGQRIPLWPLALVPLIPFYLVALLVVRVMRDRNPQPGLWLIILGILLPPIGLLLIASQDRDRPIAWGAGFGVVGLALAALFMEWAFSSNSYFFFAGGISLAFGWAAFTLRYFRVAERASFTVLAALLLAFWYVSPAGALDFIIGDLEGGPELFFLSGIVMVACGAFLIVYNADILLPPIASLGSRLGRIVPAVKTAVAYPLTARMRTGMTIMMIGLITFSLVMFSTVNDNFDNIFLSDDAKGGFETIVFVNSNNRTDDLVGALQERGVDTSPIVAVSEQRIAFAGETEIFVDNPVDPSAPGYAGTYTVIGADEAFFGANEFELKRRAAGYGSDEEVWRAVASDPTLAVIPGNLTGEGGDFSEFDLLKLDAAFVGEGFQPFDLHLHAPGTDLNTTVTVIGQMDDPGDIFWNGIIVQRDTAVAAFPDSDSQRFVIKTVGGVDQEAFAKSIESGLPQASAESFQKLLDDQRAASQGFLLLFQGFMGLGLIIGIAALGVVAFRAVVERRQQIGMLRAIGYQRSMVALSFIFESGFVALSGIALGAVLGVSLSWVLFTSGGIGEASEGADFIVPWLQLIVICGIAFGASMLMTWFPAQSASRVAVAEALRYE